MKFLTSLSTLFFALAVGTNALPSRSLSNELEVRAEDSGLAPSVEYTDLPAYTKIKSVHKDIEPGKDYVFTIKFPHNRVDPDPEMEKLKKKTRVRSHCPDGGPCHTEGGRPTQEQEN